jgi:hypothetical protein
MKPMTAAPREAMPATQSETQVARAAVGLTTLRELFAVFAATGRWWLVPIVVVLLGAAVLLVLVQAVEYVAPFVYTVF